MSSFPFSCVHFDIRWNPFSSGDEKQNVTLITATPRFLCVICTIQKLREAKGKIFLGNNE